MHFSKIILPALSAGLALADSPFLQQTETFGLGLRSGDERYDNTYLVSCHEGAAIEGLCWSGNLTGVKPSDSLRFRFNYTDVGNNPTDNGYLTYNFTYGAGGDDHPETLWVPLSLGLTALSNVAVPLFGTGPDGEWLKFDADGKLTVSGVSNWFMCDTNAGYRYNTLAWAVGRSPKVEDLDIQGCVKVDVVKIHPRPAKRAVEYRA